MSAISILETFLNGDLPFPVAADEGAFCKIWHDQGLGEAPAVSSALRGGLIADRLPWVFVAGYQAAIRHFFPDVPASGWAAYAATEDKADPVAHPPATLSADGKLHGCKSWVAQSRHVDHLLVTVGEQCVLIDAKQSGVQLSHRESPGFLGAMSQGFARFDAVTPERTYDQERMREFGRREPRYVMLAGVGYLLGQLKDADDALQRGLIGLALGLAAVCETADVAHKTLASLDRGLQSAIDRFQVAVDCTVLPQWDSDRRLLSMYSARIRERATR